MLLVAITCTCHDFLRNFEGLRQSILNFNAIFSSEVYFLVVFQSKNNDCSAVRSLFDGIPQGLFKVIPVSYLSVSRARNDALDFAKVNDYYSIIFHDASLIYNVEYLAWIKSKENYQLLSTRVDFSCKRSNHNDVTTEHIVKFHIFNDLFVWSYIFSLDTQFPYFDERFGPGESSVYASGEDFLFLKKFFELNPSLKEFLRYDGAGVLHPPRPQDYSKHLAYAEGQGKIHQIFLLEKKSLYAIWRCILFFGNSIFKIVLFRSNAAKIFALRIKGFCDIKLKI